MVHEVAAAGFGDAADYEAARPGYPPDAVAWFAEQLGIRAGARVCDLAAGTGKLTRLLVPLGADVIAAEPVAGMRAQFRTVLPDTTLVASTAEHLAFANERLDAVIVAQAWHWFDHDRAAAEVRRVLRPGGRLGLLWNARDRSIDWVDEVWSIMDRVEKRAPWRNHDSWRTDSIEMEGFGVSALTEFRHEQVLPPAAVVQRVASVSHVAVLPDAERAAVLDEVRAVLAGHDVTRGQTVVSLPYRVDCVVLTKR
jgi:SAM-dependent methyltransferase